MVRRSQLALWVLVGLVMTVVLLWERAGTSADRASGTQVEAVDGDDSRDGTPNALAFREIDEATDPGGASNVLRPTTTTTTTTTTTAPDADGGERDDGDTASSDPTVVDPEEPDSTEPRRTTTSGSPGGPTTTDGSSTGRTTVPGPPMTTVYYENFAAGELATDEWFVYHSVGHDGWGWRRRSAVEVIADPEASGGQLLEITAKMGSGLEAGQVVSGGVKLKNQSLTFGRVSFRARVDPDPDEATAGVIHLWPADDVWPDGGEINILSTRQHRATRAPVQSDLHWVGNEGYELISADHGLPDDPVSAADWHIYVLDWTPTYVSVTIDDAEPLVLTDNPGDMPTKPLDLAIQLDASDTPDRPGLQPIMTSEIRMQIDWVLIEQPVEPTE